MAEFCIEIAGRVAAVHSLFASTRDYCRAYLTPKAPDTLLSVSREDLAAEQEYLYAEARQEGIRLRTFPEPFLERAVIQRKLADFLFEDGVLLFHGSTVAVDGAAYLFTAPCGTGKSTHTRLWRQLLGERAVMVNDDKPFLRITPEGVLACGSPWSGKHGLDTNITVPLGGICVLERGQENRIWPSDPDALLPLFLHQSHCPPGREAALARLVHGLAHSVPLWQMACTKEVQAAQAAYSAMSGNHWAAPSE